MGTFRNFDPGRNILIVNGQEIQQFADGTFIKISRMTPSFSSKAGGKGDVVRSRSRDKRGKIEITLLQTSPSNDYLSALVATDEQVNGGVGAVGPSLMKDLNGSTVCKGSASWVTQPADVEIGAESSNRSWVIEVAELTMLVGGNLI